MREVNSDTNIGEVKFGVVSDVIRKIELHAIAYADANCTYILHIYYDTGFLGLFPTEPYGCLKTIGCI